MKKHYILLILFLLLLLTGCETKVRLDNSTNNCDYSDVSFLVTESNENGFIGQVLEIHKPNTVMINLFNLLNSFVDQPFDKNNIGELILFEKNYRISSVVMDTVLIRVYNKKGKPIYSESTIINEKELTSNISIFDEVGYLNPSGRVTRYNYKATINLNLTVDFFLSNLTNDEEFDTKGLMKKELRGRIRKVISDNESLNKSDSKENLIEIIKELDSEYYALTDFEFIEK